MKAGLSRTKAGFVDRIESLVAGHREITDELYDELEEVLIGADIGVRTSEGLVSGLKRRVGEQAVKEASGVKELLKEEIVSVLSRSWQPLNLGSSRPSVFMVVGVNGSGKTTTVAKLAHRFRSQGLRIILGAADTFRAAASDQLEIWANRAGVEMVRGQERADPAAIAFDSVAAAKSRKADLVIVDTAGRLQTKSNLMAELGKVHRVMERELGRGLDEVLLVMDATTGQNGLSQARLFREAVPVSGVVLAKLDGTAKGGIVVAVAGELDMPVKLLGIGEHMEDLRDFEPKEFVRALFD